MNRRTFLKSTLAASAGSGWIGQAEDHHATNPAFAQRGYYLLFNRMPLFGLEIWRDIVDCAAEDGATHLILWIAGGFASQKFPVTWQYNKEHRNVQMDFLPEVIRHAHAKGIKLLLGLTPFGYDGVNQFTIKHPELKALAQGGKGATPRFGIHAWGWSLCPAKPAAQEFMLAYTRELITDFYPEADGLFLESSDYSICHCEECGVKHFEHEFRFIRAISAELWAKKPDATIVVYPHYFSGAVVPVEGGVKAAKQPFDARWSLFFTPHSTAPAPDLIAQATQSWWWSPAPAFCDFQQTLGGASHARGGKFTGYVPTLEGNNYVPTEPEDGHDWNKGRRLIPFGFGWLAEGASPYRELPLRVIRTAFREATRAPGLSKEDARAAIGRDLFGENATPALIDDALLLTAIFSTEKNWSTPAVLTAPALLAERRRKGRVQPPQLALYRQQLTTARDLATRHSGATLPAAQEIARISQWLVSLWTDPAAASLLAELSFLHN